MSHAVKQFPFWKKGQWCRFCPEKDSTVVNVLLSKCLCINVKCSLGWTWQWKCWMHEFLSLYVHNLPKLDSELYGLSPIFCGSQGQGWVVPSFFQSVTSLSNIPWWPCPSTWQISRKGSLIHFPIPSFIHALFHSSVQQLSTGYPACTRITADELWLPLTRSHNASVPRSSHTALLISYRCTESDCK